MEAAVDFLGEAFGVRGRKRANSCNSCDRPLPSPSINACLQHAPQQAITYSAPLPQRAFSTMSSYPTMPILQQPIQYAVAHPELPTPDFDQLRLIDAHYRSIQGENVSKLDPPAIKAQELELKSTISIPKHTCGNCGRLRSRRYYAEHPINPGEIPIQEFCGKCQKDATSTSSSSRSSRSSSSSGSRLGSKHSKTKKKRSTTHKARV